MHSATLPILLALLSSAAAPPLGPVPEFNLRDPAGRTHRLSDWRQAPVVVVVFLGVECPLAKLYAPRLVELHEKYRHQGVVFVAIDSNQHDTSGDLARYARQHGITFPVLKDTGNIVADRFAAERTPEAFVLDQKRRVRYRGRIDDQYEVGLHRGKAKKSELVAAIEAVLVGKAVEITSTTAPGCLISRVERGLPERTDVSYCRDIAAILQRRCQACHRTGQSAPFTLTSYDDARNWAGAIRENVEQGRMPPWGADPRHGKFANDPSLSGDEKEKLFTWIDAGCPEGDPVESAPVRVFPEGWKIPGPDRVISMPQPFTVPAQGVIEYQHIQVDPGFTEDVWVKAAEIVPGNPAVVHHCNVFLQPPGMDDPKQVGELGVLGSYCLTMIAQGTPPMILPEGMAKRIPAGWRIVFVMHYQAVGSVQTDQTRLGLTFADPKTVRKEVATKLMYDPDLRVPPRVADHRVTQTWAVNRDVLLLSFFPHMHLRGKSFRYRLIDPEGQEEILLDVPRYDFAWQHRYVLAEPRLVAAGSQLRCEAVYDNSADNPANPDPDAEVRAGVQSWDEMFNGYFDVALAEEDLQRPPSWGERLRRSLPVIQPGVALLVCLAGGLFLTRRWLAQRL